MWKGAATFISAMGMTPDFLSVHGDWVDEFWQEDDQPVIVAPIPRNQAEAIDLMLEIAKEAGANVIVVPKDGVVISAVRAKDKNDPTGPEHLQ